jgi:hypothetical protein
VPLRRHLWVPEDAITFTPEVLETQFGDGRALFQITTINNRPAYWIVRVCSTWSSEFDYASSDEGDDFAEHVDEVIDAIEEEFGTTRYYEMNARGDWIDEETKRFIPRKWTEYPVIDADMGCSWGRLDWPDLPGASFVPHPLDASVRILRQGSTSNDEAGIKPASRQSTSNDE